MQKIFTQCYDLDQRCYEQFELTEEILMEHAAQALAQHLKKHLTPQSHLLIVAGPGNNGADGITLARLLCGIYDITLYLPYGVKSSIAQQQLDRALRVGIKPSETLPHRSDAIVDALFGAGLHRPLDPTTIELIETLNQMHGYKLACDIPTGLDTLGNPLPAAFKADATITMGALKVALFSDHAKPYVGEIEVADLGVSRHLYESHTDTFLLDANDFNPPLRHNPSSHKGDFGHLCVVTGEKEGAALLCATAALRFGVGLVTLYCQRHLSSIPFSLMQSDRCPETATAIAMGMGMGDLFDPSAIEKVLIEKDLPILLDADICHTPWIKRLLEIAPHSVITPHPKEFVALLKNLDIAEVDTNQIQQNRFGWARKFSEAYPQTVLVLKGANTLIVQAGTLYINPLGTPVLSQAGSGDMLSGLIASLLAQGYTPINAALQASLAHTLSAKRYQGANYSATAEALIEELQWLTS